MKKEIDTQAHIDHWEALIDKKYLRYFHLCEQEIEVEIENIFRFQKLVMKGGKESRRTIIKFKNKDRPLIMNATNLESLAKILGERPSQWIGKKVVLFPSQVTYFDAEIREKVTRSCIRIKEVENKKD